ncbi:MAG: S49 family peptidase [Chromatiales bacterium]|nr:S49 family peptidase [Chromatiales bacterium]
MKYPHLAARIFNTPLLIHPGKLDAIVAGLGSRLLRADIDHAPADLSADPIPAELFTTRRGESVYNRDERSYYSTQQGVAVIEVHGALAHRNQLTADSSAILGYQQIARNLEAALADDGVHAILLDVDSPGGEVSGAFELAEQIRAADARKPVYAVADSLAASAGYLIISGARQIAVAPTGYVGSIGVVMTHVDLSRALANEGLGRHPHLRRRPQSRRQPVPAAARGHPRALPGRNRRPLRPVRHRRGRRPPSRPVRRARHRSRRVPRPDRHRCASGRPPRDPGHPDHRAGGPARPRSFPVGQPARATVSPGATTMTDTTQAGASTQPAITQTDLDAAAQAGADTERTRIFAIIDSEAAAKRPQAALALARKPAIDAETAADVLAALPEEGMTLDTVEPKTGASAFERHMAALGNPPVGTDDDPSPDADARQLWGQIVARYQH